MIRVARILALAAVCSAAAVPALAVERPALDPKLGAQLDLATAVTDEQGAATSVGALTNGKPLVVLLGYDRCPNLCGIAELGLAQALQGTGLPPDQYRVLFASIDPTETAADASAARVKLSAATGDADLGPWSFVTGDAASIAALEAAVGMTVTAQPDKAQYVHPIAVAAFTPNGRLAQVLSGLDYEPNDLRLAIVQASEGKLGTLVDKFVLLCHAFDPFTGQFTPTIMTALRVAAIGTVLLLAGGIYLLSRRPGGADPGAPAS